MSNWAAMATGHGQPDSGRCKDSVVLDLWHPIGAPLEAAPGKVHTTTLLGESVSYTVDHEGRPVVWRSHPDLRRGMSVDPTAIVEPLPVVDRYCFIWTSLGNPPDELFSIPEFDEPDRRSLAVGSIGVHTSAPRAVENFLDMGHFPYVHAGILGIEPHTEVVDYDCEITDDGDVLATRCLFYQPVAAATATTGQMSEYIYRVPHPYVAMLYKTAPPDPERMDAIAIFLQCVGEEQIVAHNFICMIDDVSTETELKAFQQKIFGQDKPILENQVPRRLPLAPRAETPIRADKSSITYRRYLRELGITYGVVPDAP